MVRTKSDNIYFIELTYFFFGKQMDPFIADQLLGNFLSNFMKSSLSDKTLVPFVRTQSTQHISQHLFLYTIHIVESILRRLEIRLIFQNEDISMWTMSKSMNQNINMGKNIGGVWMTYGQI